MESGRHLPINHTGVVLAGGRSSRMGTPKALLPFEGVPLISHIVERLRATADQVVVVASPGQELPPLNATIVHDEVAYQGPVGGILYGLRAAATRLSFVTSCDSAFLNPVLIAHLLDCASGVDVVVPLWEGRYQPLHAVYSAGVVPFLEQQLARGELRPVSLFERVPTRKVEEEEIRRFDPEGWSFFNMNTPEDYARALERWTGLTHTRGDRIDCAVELYGVARLVAGTSEVALSLPAASVVSDVFPLLVEQVPALLGRVISADGGSLTEGYLCSLNGLHVVRTPATALQPGDRIVILSADAGG